MPDERKNKQGMEYEDDANYEFELIDGSRVSPAEYREETEICNLRLSRKAVRNLLVYLERVACYGADSAPVRTHVIKEDVLKLMAVVTEQTGVKLHLDEMPAGNVQATSDHQCVVSSRTGNCLVCGKSVVR